MELKLICYIHNRHIECAYCLRKQSLIFVGIEVMFEHSAPNKVISHFHH
jgi:hypothetical protein